MSRLFSKSQRKEAFTRSGGLCEAEGEAYSLGDGERCNVPIVGRGRILFDDNDGECIAICRSCYYRRDRSRHWNHISIAAERCSVEGCEKPPRNKGGGECEAHYMRRYRSSPLGSGPIHPPCAHCGNPINGNRHRFCCKQCQWTHYRKDWGWREKLKNSDLTHRSRARKHGVACEAVDLWAVVERDEFTCQICFEAIEMDANDKDPLSLSIDHEFPLGAGGGHTFENCRATHLRCNMQKNATEDTPRIAKNTRVREKAQGIRRSRRGFATNRDQPWKMTFDKGVIRR